MQEDNVEILAPAGSYEGVCAAVAAGADAVYIGGRDFSARRFAKNLSDGEIARAAALCRSRGAKLYVTVNTVLSDRELAPALAFCEMLHRVGVHGVIVQDIGLAVLLKEYVPGLAIHGSTQMTVCSLDGAVKLKEMGFSRVVLARELSAEEIEYITKNCGIETEVFVHGALCYCYSGQCLMSAVIGGRSGNRGACAGPCRLEYCVQGKKGYFMSLKDLCLVDKVKSLANAGVASLKIEGRMKRAEYVGCVTRAYAQAKRGHVTTQAEIEKLAKMFSRSGFTDGYYTGKKGASMLGKKGDDTVPSQLLEAEKRAYEKLLKAQFAVTAAERDEEKAKAFIAQKAPQKRGFCKYAPIAVCRTAEQAMAAKEATFVYLPAKEYLKLGNRQNCGIDFPAVLKDGEKTAFMNLLKSCGAKYARISNIGQTEIAKSLDMQVLFSPAMNVYNGAAVSAAQKLGADGVTLSVEASYPQIRDIAKKYPVGIMAYGRIRLMTTENCVVNCSGSCDKKSCKLPASVTDRAGARFLAFRESGCKNALFNDKPTWLADKLGEIRQLALTHIELHFTDESAKRVKEVIGSYTGGEKLPPRDYTRGMYGRKVM